MSNQCSIRSLLAFATRHPPEFLRRAGVHSGPSTDHRHDIPRCWGLAGAQVTTETQNVFKSAGGHLFAIAPLLAGRFGFVDASFSVSTLQTLGHAPLLAPGGLYSLCSCKEDVDSGRFEL